MNGAAFPQPDRGKLRSGQPPVRWVPAIFSFFFPRASEKWFSKAWAISIVADMPNSSIGMAQPQLDLLPRDRVSDGEIATADHRFARKSFFLIQTDRKTFARTGAKSDLEIAVPVSNVFLERNGLFSLPVKQTQRRC